MHALLIKKLGLLNIDLINVCLLFSANGVFFSLTKNGVIKDLNFFLTWGTIVNDNVFLTPNGFLQHFCCSSSFLPVLFFLMNIFSQYIQVLIMCNIATIISPCFYVCAVMVGLSLGRRALHTVWHCSRPLFWWKI